MASIRQALHSAKAGYTASLMTGQAPPLNSMAKVRHACNRLRYARSTTQVQQFSQRIAELLNLEALIHRQRCQETVSWPDHQPWKMMESADARFIMLGSPHRQHDNVPPGLQALAISLTPHWEAALNDPPMLCALSWTCGPLLSGLILARLIASSQRAHKQHWEALIRPASRTRKTAKKLYKLDQRQHQIDLMRTLLSSLDLAATRPLRPSGSSAPHDHAGLRFRTWESCSHSSSNNTSWQSDEGTPGGMHSCHQRGAWHDLPQEDPGGSVAYHDWNITLTASCNASLGRTGHSATSSSLPARLSNWAGMAQTGHKMHLAYNNQEEHQVMILAELMLAPGWRRSPLPGYQQILHSLCQRHLPRKEQDPETELDLQTAARKIALQSIKREQRRATSNRSHGSELELHLLSLLPLSPELTLVINGIRHNLPCLWRLRELSKQPDNCHTLAREVIHGRHDGDLVLTIRSELGNLPQQALKLLVNMGALNTMSRHGRKTENGMQLSRDRSWPRTTLAHPLQGAIRLCSRYRRESINWPTQMTILSRALEAATGQSGDSGADLPHEGEGSALDTLSSLKQRRTVIPANEHLRHEAILDQLARMLI